MTSPKLRREKPYNLLSKALKGTATPRNKKTNTFSPFSPVAPLQDALKPLPDKSTLTPLPLPIPGERNAAYKAACLLTHQIDQHLTYGTGHYYNRAGQLLTTLDQVVIAIINDNLRV